MNGIELSKQYFFQVGLPLIQHEFPLLSQRMAAGLVAGTSQSGAGSEVGGFDDEISRDHNWGPRFFVFLTEHDMNQSGEALQNYLNDKLPSSFAGHELIATTLHERHTIVTTPTRNLQDVLQVSSSSLCDEEWLCLPELLLFEYTAGDIFYEPMPLISPVREQFSYYPDEVWFKRISFGFFNLHAAGNAARMVKRDDAVATHFYLSFLIETVMRLCFLLCRKYAPYRKWLFRAFTTLPNLPKGLAAKVEALATHINLNTIEQQMYEVLDMVGAMANSSGLIEPLPLRKESSYIWTDFNCYGFMEAFEQKLQGPLKGRPYEGPLDMWVANQGPLKPNLMKAAWQPL